MLHIKPIENKNGEFSKRKFIERIDCINDKLRLAEQKITVKMDNRILQTFHRLENELSYTEQTLQRLHQSVKMSNNSQLKQDIQFTKDDKAII